MASIRNPILPGFNPDPSICRAGDDYYIATSTFEWYPGVQIHHSRDLVNWRLVGRPLDRASQLDLRGNPDSCGVWAPALSFADGQFWLVYTDVKRYDGNFKDTHNYLVTAPSIDGPWSDPVSLNASGFDPSLFHDEDGRKWLANLVWDHRARSSAFGGILLQEYDASKRRLLGPITNIFRGSALGRTEGPHIFKRNGWYYLITAEGGTGYDHAVTMARARTIGGPYELHPQTHVITARGLPDAPLQRAGHGNLVETPAGPYHTHLCSRPLPGTRRSPMGREAAIQRTEWRDDDWLWLADGGQQPGLDVAAPSVPAQPFAPEPARIRFDCDILPLAFQWLRTPVSERIYSLTARPGHLRLYGRESIGSWCEQALVARRQTSWSYAAETVVEFEPQSYQQLAGLTAYYNRYQFHYLAVTADGHGGRVLTVLSCPGEWPEGRLQFPLEQDIQLPPEGPVYLGIDVDRNDLRFRYSLDAKQWLSTGPALDASVLSDEAGRGEHANFTGAFVGMCAQDLTGSGLPADFAYFDYCNR